MRGKKQLSDRLRQVEDTLLKIRAGIAVSAPLLLLVLGKIYSDNADIYKHHEQQKQELTQLHQLVQQALLKLENKAAANEKFCRP